MGLSMKLNKNLIFTIIYIFILIVSFFIGNFYISLLSSIIIYLIIFFVDINLGVGIVFSLLPLSGIYDSSGFLYVFNFSIIVIVFKLLIKALLENKMNQNTIKCIIILGILFSYELFNTIINDVFSSSYLGNLAIWFGYVLLILIPCYLDTLDKRKIFLLTYLGFILSCLLCLVQIYTKWGFDIPSVYRFVGLLRDPNYYSFIAIILLYSSLYVIKGKIKYIIAASILGFGLLSVSKMYILLCLLGGVLYIFYYFYLFALGKVNGVKYFVSFVIVGAIVMIILYLTGAISFIYVKYIYRFESYKLTTGRDYIQGQFINILTSDIYTLVFGRTLDYNKIYMIAYADSEAMLAHNTYLDLLMSFGVIGSFIYIYFIYNIFKLYSSDFKMTGQVVILILLSILTLFALSYLKADNFTICILFILVSACGKKQKKEVLLYEKQNNYVRSNA